MERLDAHITREPPEPPEPMVCPECGAEVPDVVIEKIEQYRYHRCDGQPQVLPDQRHDESVLAIIGEEHRDDVFSIAYPPPCCRDAGEISDDSDTLESYRHETHFFLHPLDVTTTLVRVCPNGHEVREQVV